MLHIKTVSRVRVTNDINNVYIIPEAATGARDPWDYSNIHIVNLAQRYSIVSPSELRVCLLQFKRIILVKRLKDDDPVRHFE